MGTSQLYSHLGYYLLGKIIEKVTKKTFNQYFLQNRVFAGINNTLFNPATTEFGNTAPTQFDSGNFMSKIKKLEKELSEGKLKIKLLSSTEELQDILDCSQILMISQSL